MNTNGLNICLTFCNFFSSAWVKVGEWEPTVNISNNYFDVWQGKIYPLDGIENPNVSHVIMA